MKQIVFKHIFPNGINAELTVTRHTDRGPSFSYAPKYLPDETKAEFQVWVDGVFTQLTTEGHLTIREIFDMLSEAMKFCE